MSENTKVRVVHCKREPYDVYIGRGSKWGNPFSHKTGTQATTIVASRIEAIKSYKQWILGQPELLKAIPELKGKTLGCWCKPKACHGDVLAELVILSEEELSLLIKDAEHMQLLRQEAKANAGY